MNKLFRYIKFWFLMSKNAFMIVFSDKLGFAIFLLGKVIRFFLYLWFLYFLVRGTKTLVNFNVNQTIFFFLTFNIIDIISQFLFREVYRFRSLVVTGAFDLILVKPVNALFRVLMGGADFIDFVTIPPLLVITWYVGSLLNPSLLQTILYIFLIINGLLIATAFHIAVLALGIITLEIDHTIMIYRDLTTLGRFPIDIYKEPLRGVLTFLVPVAIMITYPAKAFMGLISFRGVLSATLIAIVAFYASLSFWKFALKKYTSASS